MTQRHALTALIKWMERDPWRDRFLYAMAEHAAEACDDAGITVPEIADVLGQPAAMAVWGAVFEDFLTRAYGEDARTLVDDYLKRRGWKETAVNRRYMEAIRDSVMSVYEVSAIVPGESFLTRDLIRGGDLIRVSERSATTMLKPWDRMAARIVEVNGKTVMTGGSLLLEHATSDELVEAFKAEPEVLGMSAHEFTLAWLEDSLRRVLTRPKIVNHDGDAIVFHTVRFPLAGGAAADTVRARLRDNDALREESATFWNWIEPDGPPAPSTAGEQRFVSKTSDGYTVLGTIELTEDALVLQVNSEGRAVRGQAMLAPLLGDVVRDPSVSTEPVRLGKGEEEDGD